MYRNLSGMQYQQCIEYLDLIGNELSKFACKRLYRSGYIFLAYIGSNSMSPPALAGLNSVGYTNSVY